MRIFHIPAVTVFSLFCFVTITLGSDKALDPKKSTEKTIKPGLSEIMHPRISLLDKEGNIIKDEKGIISTERTCGQCHDYQYIDRHNNHNTPVVKADCVVCHFKEGRVGEKDYSGAHLRIQLPTDENCGQCHGIVHNGTNPLTIPADYEKIPAYKEGEKYNDITQHTGVILSGQNLSASALNLKNKKELHFSWDVHSHRQMNCISCHFTGNDSRFLANIPTSLAHLILDPRKAKSPGEILKRPDHNLKFASCTDCHNPLKAHKRLPYKERHMEVLSCQSCHVPEIYGPALQTIDQTVIKADGTPRLEYRGVDESKSHGTAVNTRYFEGYQPFLFSHLYQPPTVNTNEKKALPQYKISPFNLITHWYWKSGTTGQPVADSLLQKVYLGSSGNEFAEDILKTLDADKNRVIDAAELVLDSQEKVNLIREKLKALGISEPVIAGEIKAYKINHGVVEFLHTKRDCSGCHAPAGKFGREIILTGTGPAGVIPKFSDKNVPHIAGTITLDKRGQVILKPGASLPGYYVFGHGRSKWLDLVGYGIFFLALLGIIGHGILRRLSSLKHPARRAAAKKVYMYRFYERLWHWTMAAGIILLALTGLEIHHTGNFSIFGLEYAAALHNILAAILIINAFLALFYHLTTGEIRQFFKFNRYFVKEAAAQVLYYIQGIFKGAPHPIPKTVERKLNPLQQIIYVGLLNILLPFQVITGIMIWGANKWPVWFEKLGGLTHLAPIHHLGTWLFLSFLMVHLYLTTTGHTILSNVRAMITGYDEVEEENNEQTK